MQSSFLTKTKKVTFLRGFCDWFWFCWHAGKGVLYQPRCYNEKEQGMLGYEKSPLQEPISCSLMQGFCNVRMDHFTMGSHQHQVSILVPDEKLSCFYF